MNQYLLLTHDNVRTTPSSEEWNEFFRLAMTSDAFKGGSALGERIVFGDKLTPSLSSDLGGYMRFETDDLEQLHGILERHPVVIHGGTVELFELPRS